MAEETKKLNILLVEDDVFMVDLLGRELTRAGFSMVVAGNGKEAVEKFESVHPDLILLDLILPDENGFDALRQIRRKPGGPEAKVIVFSNIAEMLHVDEAKRLGAVDYLIKANYTLAEVVEKVRKHLAV